MASRLLVSRLPVPLVLALRYLKSTRRDAFTTFLSVVAVTAIAVGVAALVLSLAALSGFQDVLRTEVLERTPAIEVELPAGADAAAAARRAGAVSGVATAEPVLRGQGWVLVAGQVAPVEVLGFAGERPPILAGIEGAGPGLYLSRQQAQSLGLERGDVVEVVSPRPTLTPFGPQPRVRSVRLAGTFAGSRVEERERAAVPLAVAESLFGGGRQRLLVEPVGGLEGADEVARALAPVLPPGSRVATWRELNRPLFFALRLERALVFVAVALIVLVASLALLADLSLVIASKRADLGMLLTLGARPRTLRRAFLALGALLVGIGSVTGALLGVAAAVVLDRERLVALPGDVFFVDHVPFLVRPVDLAAVIGVTWVLALGAAFYAASRAATLTPVEALGR